MDAVKKNRRPGLDALKYLCAFLVICIHANEYIGKAQLEPLMRTAVPIFFMISGYFYTDTLRCGRCGAQIKKLLLIFALYSLIIIALTIFMDSFVYGSSLYSLYWWTKKERWIEFVFFGCPSYAKPLWYIVAMVEALWIVPLAERFVPRERSYPLIPVLLLINLLLGSYSGLVFPGELSVVASRNFLFTGLPYFLLGDMLRHYEDRIRLSSWWLVGILLLSQLCCRLEIDFLHSMKLEVKDMYIGTAFSATAMVLLALRVKGERAEKLLALPACLGRRYSLGVYLCHGPLLSYVPHIFKGFFQHYQLLYALYKSYSPLIVLLLSTVLSACGLGAWRYAGKKLARTGSDTVAG